MKSLFIFLTLIVSSSMSGQPSFPFIEISEVSKTIIKEVRYATPYNFVGEVIEGYHSSKCYLTPSAAEALAKVQNQLEKQSYALKIFDCFRPQRAVDHFVKWAKSARRDQTKHLYFPRVPSDELFDRGYIAHKSGHSRGSTVDLTIVKLPYSPPTNYSHNCLDPDSHKLRGSELNMGTGFDCFDEMSHTQSNEHPLDVIENRRLLLKVMEAQGFVNYSKEWWHFTYKPEDHPDTYFDFPIE